MKKHYYTKDYVNALRFISYSYQIDLIKKLKPKKVLEIGVGNKVVANYLKDIGIKITTVDNDRSLKPDKVADIRKLPFKENAFDCVVACQVLEHLDWKDVETALNELHRVSKNNVIISVPYSSYNFEFVIKFSGLNKIFKKRFGSLILRIPTLRLHKSGEHEWEMGKKNYSKNKFKKLLKNKFKIIKEVRPVLNSYHHFFVLEKL